MYYENFKSKYFTQYISTNLLIQTPFQMSEKVLIENNTNTHSFGESIDIILFDNCTVRINHMKDIFPLHVYVDNTKTVVIENNVLIQTRHYLSLCPSTS